jgi:hypothetical protein
MFLDIASKVFFLTVVVIMIKVEGLKIEKHKGQKL